MKTNINKNKSEILMLTSRTNKNISSRLTTGPIMARKIPNAVHGYNVPFKLVLLSPSTRLPIFELMLNSFLILVAVAPAPAPAPEPEVALALALVLVGANKELCNNLSCGSIDLDPL